MLCWLSNQGCWCATAAPSLGMNLCATSIIQPGVATSCALCAYSSSEYDDQLYNPAQGLEWRHQRATRTLPFVLASSHFCVSLPDLLIVAARRSQLLRMSAWPTRDPTKVCAISIVCVALSRGGSLCGNHAVKWRAGIPLRLVNMALAALLAFCGCQSPQGAADACSMLLTAFAAHFDPPAAIPRCDSHLG